MKFEARSGNRSSLRMASDLTTPISRSYSEQSSFASLTSDSGSIDEQPDDDDFETNDQDKDIREEL